MKKNETKKRNKKTTKKLWHVLKILKVRKRERKYIRFLR